MRWHVEIHSSVTGGEYPDQCPRVYLRKMAWLDPMTPVHHRDVAWPNDLSHGLGGWNGGMAQLNTPHSHGDRC